MILSRTAHNRTGKHIGIEGRSGILKIDHSCVLPPPFRETYFY